MSIRPYRDIYRRRSRQINVGPVPVGGDAPITVQSMTNTLTSDVAATVDQIRALTDVGADIVRVSCPDRDSTEALKQILPQVQVPIVADIHFHYKRAIEAAIQSRQHINHRRIHRDGVRRIGDLDQGAVDIEE